MQMLIRLEDPVSLQALADTLTDFGIGYRVDNAGMHALMPLPDVMDMRIFVADGDFAAACRIARDLGMEPAHD